MNHRSKKNVSVPVDENNKENDLMIQMKFSNNNFVSIGLMVLLFATSAWIVIQKVEHLLR